MKLAYFVHDLTDPAVTRRVRMLRAGGAQPVVIGFRRAEAAPCDIAGAAAVDLGRTYDGRFGQRAFKAAMAALSAPRWRSLLRDCDVVLARMLEMLFVADAARRVSGSRARLVYECLDVHRLMVASGAKAEGLRRLERALLARCDLLVVSSPAFLENYFEPVQGVGRGIPLRSLLVENKLLELGGPPARHQPAPPRRPWRIAWLGAIRCRRSLAILSDLARRRPDLVEVRIHGRPAYGEFDDFDAEIAAVPGLSFGGAYEAADLPSLYGAAHFSWAIDYMEQGLNSAWLLPNRLYESGRFGVPPIALAGVETGRFLQRLDAGLLIGDPAELEARLEALTSEDYAGLRRRMEAVPRTVFAADADDCRRLVEALAGRSDSVSAAGRLVA